MGDFLLRVRGRGLAGVALAVLGVLPVRADPLPRQKPEALGLSSQRLGRIRTALEADVAAGQIPGAVVAIARRGKLAYFEAIGYLDRQAGVPMPRDAIFSIASMTKPFAGVAAMILQEEGRLHLADPVARYLPALGAMRVAAGGAAPGAAIATVPPLHPVSLQDLMRHTSGMVYGSGASPVQMLWPPSSALSSRTWDAEAFIARLASLPLVYQPSTTWAYGVSIDVLGLVVERVAQHSLGQFLAARVFEPLGMVDTSFVVPPPKVARYAHALPRDPETGAPQAVPDSTQPTKFECGGGCAVSTAADYLRFAEMLRQRGTLGTGRAAVRVLSRKSVELMTAESLGPEIGNPSVALDPTRAGNGFGLTMAVRREAGLSPYLGSAGEYGWGGANGTHFWVDPHEELVVVFMAHTPGAKREYYRKLMNALVLAAVVD
jgi:CubicO group peptidase (beta-lactamase class C family)